MEETADIYMYIAAHSTVEAAESCHRTIEEIADSCHSIQETAAIAATVRWGKKERTVLIHQVNQKIIVILTNGCVV